MPPQGARTSFHPVKRVPKRGASRMARRAHASGAMVHAHSARVIEEWARRRGAARRPPSRAELSPALFGPLLPQMFVLADDGGEWRFRVAGSRLEALHGLRLSRMPFLDLWTFDDRPRVRAALAAVNGGAAPRVVACRAETPEGGGLALELVLAPLTGSTGGGDRVLGLHQPLSRLAALQGHALGRLSLAASAGTPPLRLVVDNTRDAPLG